MIFCKIEQDLVSYVNTLINKDTSKSKEDSANDASMTSLNRNILVKVNQQGKSFVLPINQVDKVKTMTMFKQKKKKGEVVGAGERNLYDNFNSAVGS